MALRKPLTITKENMSGVLSYNDAYWKVSTVSGDKETQMASVTVWTGDITDILDEKAYWFTPDMDGPNFIKQAYEHLKSLPEFSDAEDL
jgi:hypothetical protein